MKNQRNYRIMIILVLSIVSCSSIKLPIQIEYFKNSIMKDPQLLMDIKNNFPDNYDKVITNIFLNDSSFLKENIDELNLILNSYINNISFDEVNISKNSFLFHQRYKKLGYIKEKLMLIYILEIGNETINRGIAFYFVVDYDNNFYMFDIRKIQDWEQLKRYID